MSIRSIFCLIAFLVAGCGGEEPEPEPGKLEVVYVYVGDEILTQGNLLTGAPIDELIEIRFSAPVLRSSVTEAVTLVSNGQPVAYSVTYFDGDKLLKIDPGTLEESATYSLTIGQTITGAAKETYTGGQYSFTTLVAALDVNSVKFDGAEVNILGRIIDISREPVITIEFNYPVTQSQLTGKTLFLYNGAPVTHSITQINSTTFDISPGVVLQGYGKYNLRISSTLAASTGRPFQQKDIWFYTELDPAPKFPVITDEELLTLVQQQTFRYFWDFGHPVSGLARERNTSNETVTAGGSGFGIMSMIVAIERGFITRQQGLDRMATILDFLANKAQRYHGAFAHWMNGTTGATVPFSSLDNGADLVETAFLIQGLIAWRQYLDPLVPAENTLISQITAIVDAVEWNWFQQNGQQVLYWHWSPNNGWQINLKISGWNESLIIYVLAASSKNHSIAKSVYDNGWARNGAMKNGNTYYGITLPLGYSYGGPLFFSHYSFLGLDPRNLSDSYSNYWDQNVAHSQINQAHSIVNPNKYVGYKEYSWGLTASDNHEGYNAHSPTNDKGVITPTAALSSFPYTPEASMKALKHFYYEMGDKLWGPYGFYDAFNPTENWYATSTLAIDQGPIICMIENYRTGLLWDLFMQDADVKAGLDKLGFTY